MRRQQEIAKGSPRRAELESELSQSLGLQIRLTPASSKGGYDEIYYADQPGNRVAVVRVNSPYKTQNDPIGPADPGVPLAAIQRLSREWDAYQALSPLQLSPRPIWRTHDAIACSWIDWPRASVTLAKFRSECWQVFERLIPAIARMHHRGITHLDLNLGNVLIERCGSGVAIIDFEFGPVDWVNLDQQMAFDYLRVVDDFTKPRRGGTYFLAAPTRLIDGLERWVPAAARDAEVGFSLQKLRRLRDNPQLCSQLRAIFPRL
jgi:hypothetical protein